MSGASFSKREVDGTDVVGFQIEDESGNWLWSDLSVNTNDQL